MDGLYLVSQRFYLGSGDGSVLLRDALECLRAEEIGVSVRLERRLVLGSGSGSVVWSMFGSG